MIKIILFLVSLALVPLAGSAEVLPTANCAPTHTGSRSGLEVPFGILTHKKVLVATEIYSESAGFKPPALMSTPLPLDLVVQPVDFINLADRHSTTPLSK